MMLARPTFGIGGGGALANPRDGPERPSRYGLALADDLVARLPGPLPAPRIAEAARRRPRRHASHDCSRTGRPTRPTPLNGGEPAGNEPGSSSANNPNRKGGKRDSMFAPGGEVPAPTPARGPTRGLESVRSTADAHSRGRTARGNTVVELDAGPKNWKKESEGNVASLLSITPYLTPPSLHTNLCPTFSPPHN